MLHTNAADSQLTITADNVGESKFYLVIIVQLCRTYAQCWMTSFLSAHIWVTRTKFVQSGEQ